MNHSDKIRIAHLIDFLSPNYAPWFQLLIQKLDSDNLIFPYKTKDISKIKCDNFKIIPIFNFPSLGIPYVEKAIRFINWHVRFYTLKSALKKKNIQIIHAHFAHVGWEAIKLKKVLNIPLVVSFYGYDYKSVPYKYPVWEKRYKNLFKHADLIICEGDNGKVILSEMGCDSDKIKVSKLGVEISNIQFEEIEKPVKELKLVQIANLVEKKGHVYTVESFAKVLKANSNMQLTIIGDGSCKSNILRAIETHELQDKITLIDRIDYSNLHEILSKFHVFIHPSCYTEDMDCEGGAPIVLLDAQAVGLPVISTTHCDIPDEVIHNKTGYLAGERDIDDIANGIELFYNMNQDMYSDFSINARKHVENNYDIIINAKNLINLYITIVK